MVNRSNVKGSESDAFDQGIRGGGEHPEKSRTFQFPEGYHKRLEG